MVRGIQNDVRHLTAAEVDLEVRNVQVFQRERGGPGDEKCTGVSEGKRWTWR